MVVLNLAELPAAEICQRAGIEEEANSLLDDETSAAELLSGLEDKGVFPDAIRFLAHAFEPGRALRWALECSKMEITKETSEDDLQLLAGVESYLADPSDEIRRALGTRAEEVGLERHPAWVAMAAYLSGGSLAPPELDVVPPPPDACARSAGGAILLATVEKKPETAADRARKFLARGREVAEEDLPELVLELPPKPEPQELEHMPEPNS